MGFDESEIAHALSSQSRKEDIVPDPPDDPITKTGDLYLLGNHRLLCGDATIGGDVQRLLNGVVPLLMVTDPPYGVDYDPEWRTDVGINKTHQNVSTGKVNNDNQSDWQPAWDLFPGDVLYVWHGGLHAAQVAQGLEAVGFLIRSQIIWVKQSLVIGRGHYHWQHEPCWYAVRKGKTGSWEGDRKQATIWSIPNTHPTQGDANDKRTKHSTQKPVECMRRPIINNSSPGQAVYDPFLGSGTTLIAAETEGRVCYGMEIDPIYCDVIVKRWEEFTGERATCEKAENRNPLN